MSLPISALFAGINGLIALALSYGVAIERTTTRTWHGESAADVITQPHYSVPPNRWAAFVERYTQRNIATKSADDGLLQRKVRAYGNFTEYVPLGLLFVILLELMPAPTMLTWLLGGTLTVGRVAHAWGLMSTYGPSPGRAIGFFLTGLVYLIGASACIYYGLVRIWSG